MKRRTTTLALLLMLVFPVAIAFGIFPQPQQRFSVPLPGILERLEQHGGSQPAQGTIFGGWGAGCEAREENGFPCWGLYQTTLPLPQ